MNLRRRVIFALGSGLCAAATTLRAQPRAKEWRVGFLAFGFRSTPASDRLLGTFTRALGELGYVEGKNLRIEKRFAEGKNSLFDQFSREFVQLNVDVILAATTNAVFAAQRATKTIPIVMVQTGDPVGLGIVTSLARPGGNITGLSNMSTEIGDKYLELLRSTLPRLKTVAVWKNRLVNNFQRIEASARIAGVNIVALEAQDESGIEPAFAAAARELPDAMIVTPSPLYSAHSRKIAELAIASRIPTLFWTPEHVEAGGMMSYGQSIEEHYARAAAYVDKILRGAKPAELPVEQATKVELVVNQKTAKAIGVSFSKEILVRADRIIE